MTIAAKFLPGRSEIVIEPADYPTGNAERPFFHGRAIGVQLPEGGYDPRYGLCQVLTMDEALARAALLSVVTKLPIRDLDVYEPTGPCDPIAKDGGERPTFGGGLDADHAISRVATTLFDTVVAWHDDPGAQMIAVEALADRVIRAGGFGIEAIDALARNLKEGLAE